MKTQKHILPLLAGFALLAGQFVYSGCAGTATRQSTGQYIDDTAITTKVKSALLSDKQVSGLAVEVETFNQTVQLSGFVDDEAQKQRAETLTRNVAGVTDVINNIQIKPRSDRNRNVNDPNNNPQNLP